MPLGLLVGSLKTPPFFKPTHPHHILLKQHQTFIVSHPTAEDSRSSSNKTRSFIVSKGFKGTPTASNIPQKIFKPKKTNHKSIPNSKTKPPPHSTSTRLSDVHSCRRAVGLPEGSTHAAAEAIGARTGEGLVDAQNVEGMRTDADVEEILGEGEGEKVRFGMVWGLSLGWKV